METLTLEQVYYIGQTISALAVVISLIYVGLQIKQNTIATQTASSQAYVTADNEIVGLVNTSPVLADILHQGASGLSSLKGGDLIRFMAFHEQVFISFQSFHLQWQRGTLDDSLWVTYKQAFLDLLQQKGQQEWWEMRRHWFNQEFQKYVDFAVTEEVATPMHPGSNQG